ncbi:hypothetical protein BCR39DRAFT_545886 [Naematelia encephala]|uniref:Thioredoxin-like fold domain-containing protein n=1 Tax=Naematelia encephala TaxID=71784 RepID=A0A1Y2AQC1_9TREE|nr:hypothetical protein BCR39DRAFT_545886 [Naematelia encephala]
MGSSLEVPPDLIGQSSLYNSPDPLLRRLRLDDSTGSSISDVERYFKGKEVLVLYAGSEAGSNNLKHFHRDLTTMVMRYLKTLGVIYISTDTSPSAPQRVLASHPWLRLIFADNSDFASPGDGKGKEVEMEEVARGEEFIQAGEIELGMEKVEFGLEENENDYVRPLSRAAVTALMSAYATPSVSIYHLGTHTFIAKNVRLSAFESHNIDKNYATWRNGGTPSLRLIDILTAMKWPLILLVLAVLYHSLVYFGGQEYHVLPRLLDSLSWQSKSAGVVKV